MVFATCAFSNSYATGGDTLTPGSLGFASFDDEAKDPLIIQSVVARNATANDAVIVIPKSFPETDGTVKIGAARDRNAISGAATGIQVTAAVDLSLYTFDIIAMGR
jgi:hypothetical protein